MAYRDSRVPNDERAQYMRDECATEPGPGVLAYVDGEVAGWCSVAPRSSYRRLMGSRTIPFVDERDAWSIVCFVVRPAFRRQGLMHELLEGAVAHAAEHGAEVVEGYPVDRRRRRPGGRHLRVRGDEPPVRGGGVHAGGRDDRAQRWSAAGGHAAGGGRMTDDTALRGRLLVATPRLREPTFHRTVILLLDHGEEGAIGVVLNRPSTVDVGVVLPDWQEHVSDPPRLFHGGPVGLDGAMGVAALPHGSGPVAGGRPGDGPVRPGGPGRGADVGGAARGWRPGVRRARGVGRAGSWRTSWPSAPGTWSTRSRTTC